MTTDTTNEAAAEQWTQAAERLSTRAELYAFDVAIRTDHSSCLSAKLKAEYITAHEELLAAAATWNAAQ